jgi:hypothetical protein
MPSKHFEKTHKRESVLWRNSTYREDTGAGFCTGAWESHHICCNHAVEGREINKNKEYVEECLWITPWDLNTPGNLSGLPKNRQYRNTDGQVPVNLCSHQVDHNTSDGYTAECKKWLKTHVWDKLNDKRKKHEVNAKASSSYPVHLDLQDEARPPRCAEGGHAQLLEEPAEGRLGLEVVLPLLDGAAPAAPAARRVEREPEGHLRNDLVSAVSRRRADTAWTS